MSEGTPKAAVPIADLFGLTYWPALPAFLVSTADAQGKPHVSPFSLVTFSSYTGVAEDPETPIVASVIIGDYSSFEEVMNSTTYRNIRETGEFVINVPSAAIARKVNRAGAPHPDKFAECELTAEPSAALSAPSVADCAVNLECQLEEIESRRWLGEIVYGRVVGLRIDAAVAAETDPEARMRLLDPIYHYSFDHENGCFYQLGKMILVEGKGE